MATAGNHKIIIEKGMDFSIDVQVSENGIVHKDLTGYTVSMSIKFEDEQGLIQVLDTIVGDLVPDNPTEPEVDWTYFNGYLNVTIDKLATSTYDTRVAGDLHAFSTAYEYYYSIDIVGPGSSDFRVLRGKCAIREG